ncbi:hypothetical protein HYDPIDRAFT_36369 [Hydnomerulius pinastri MD-312]|nr:hypothetical protein HYDPIDRAFT_36369 [Hydnomerulius pinastri MD-312]
MSSGIEMDDLSQSRRKDPSAEAAKGVTGPTDDETSERVDGTISLWAWSSAATLAAFSLCLLMFPRFLLFLAEPSGGRGTLTSLEKYIALQLGIILGTTAVTIISTIPNEWPTGPRYKGEHNSHPLLGPVTAASLMMALLSYNNRSVGALATLALFGSGVVGLFGLWMLVFAGSSATSRKTGADKHTSSFIFGNRSAASVKKKLWKRGQERKHVG